MLHCFIFHVVGNAFISAFLVQGFNFTSLRLKRREGSGKWELGNLFLFFPLLFLKKKIISGFFDLWWWFVGSPREGSQKGFTNSLVNVIVVAGKGHRCYVLFSFCLERLNTFWLEYSPVLSSRALRVVFVGEKLWECRRFRDLLLGVCGTKYPWLSIASLLRFRVNLLSFIFSCLFFGSGVGLRVESHYMKSYLIRGYFVVLHLFLFFFWYCTSISFDNYAEMLTLFAIFLRLY